MRVVLGVVVALALMIQLPVVEASDWTRVVKALQGSTVPIACSAHKIHICTAFSINYDQGLYMTARHCTQPFEGNDSEKGAPSVIEEFPTFNGKPLFLVFESDALDLAILKSYVKTPALRYRTKPTDVGQAVGAYGYGYGGATPIFRVGVVSVFQRDERGSEWMLLDTPLVRGMSGGPIVDEDGRVVGVNKATDQTSGTSLSVTQIKTATQFWE